MTGASDLREAGAGDGGTLAKALDVIGTRSALLILREALLGTTRFRDFADRAGISEPATAARLRELVGHGVLEREDYQRPGQRTRQRYRLTAEGADFLPVLVALMQWSDRLVRRARRLHHREARRGRDPSALLASSVGAPVNTPGVVDLQVTSLAVRAACSIDKLAYSHPRGAEWTDRC